MIPKDYNKIAHTFLYEHMGCKQSTKESISFGRMRWEFSKYVYHKYGAEIPKELGEALKQKLARYRFEDDEGGVHYALISKLLSRRGIQSPIL